MSLLEELYTAVYSELGSYPSGSPVLTWYGPGVAPNDVDDPVLMWSLIAGIEDNAMQLGTDYYSLFTFQFTAGSSDKSPLEAVQIIEAVKTLFRNNTNGLTLSTGRVLDIDIGTTRLRESTPGMDGWLAMVDIAFEVGT